MESDANPFRVTLVTATLIHCWGYRNYPYRKCQPMRMLRSVLQWLVAWIYPTKVRWQSEYVEELPDDPQKGIVYLVKEGEQVWLAVLRCPCGCNSVIQLCCIRKSRPSWRYQINSDGGVSLHPSVWRTTGCKSHFFIRDGKIRWC